MSDAESKPARRISRFVGPFHNISYYAPEMKTFADRGIAGYWRAYMAYRSAPMGRAPAAAVEAAFYNFSARTVAAAIPSAWLAMTPAEAIELRDECVDRALRRSLGELTDSAEVAEADALVRQAIEDQPGPGRVLYAAHTELPWPTTPHMSLWHGCTLWREYRGDGHNIALAAANLDGVECHVLVAARTGPKTAATIRTIRGWSNDEWAGAVERLHQRGLVEPDGSFTEAGRTLRREIEDKTDELATAPCERVGPDAVDRLCELMTPIVGHMVETGAIAGSWPPDTAKTPPQA